MFKDAVVKFTDIVPFLPKMTRGGLNSVAYVTKLRPATIMNLKRVDLEKVIFKSLEERMGSTSFRFYEDDKLKEAFPVGIPLSDVSDSQLNEMIVKKGLVINEGNYGNTVSTSLDKTPVEVLPKDVYQLGHSAKVDFLSATVNVQPYLLRLTCENGATCVDRIFGRVSMPLEQYDPSQVFQRYAYGKFLEYLQYKIAELQKHQVNYAVLEEVMPVAKKMNDKNLIEDLNLKKTDIMNMYEVPKDAKGKKMGQVWKETAVLDFSMYELWNLFTRKLEEYRIGKAVEEAKKDYFGLSIDIAKVIMNRKFKDYNPAVRKVVPVSLNV